MECVGQVPRNLVPQSTMISVFFQISPASHDAGEQANLLAFPSTHVQLRFHRLMSNMKHLKEEEPLVELDLVVGMKGHLKGEDPQVDLDLVVVIYMKLAMLLSMLV